MSRMKTQHSLIIIIIIIIITLYKNNKIGISGIKFWDGERDKKRGPGNEG